jgi:starvation-inducible DNA-binding protein
MTVTDLQPVPDTARFTSAPVLQRLLPELVALTLDLKQAHWNVTGPGFLPLHVLTDEVAAGVLT